MWEKDYKLWKDYHYGRIKRKLSQKEYSEIRANEFAMNLLIPTKLLLVVCGGYHNLESINLNSNDPVVRKLAESFKVPVDVMIVKIHSLITEKERKKSIAKKKILKRQDNIITVKFN